MPATRLLHVAILSALVFVICPTPAGAMEPPPPEKRRAAADPPPPDAIAASRDLVAYSNDFETTVGREWSLPITDTTPNGGRTFLGQFGNDSVGLALEDLPHQSVMVTFDLFIIRTWDGNLGDHWELALANGGTIFRTTFSNMDDFGHRQAYPDASPGGNHLARTGAQAVNTLGFRDKGSRRDSVYRLAITFDHTAPALKVNFRGSGLQELADESWGLDNVRIILRDEPRIPRSEGLGSGALKFDGVDDCVTIPASRSLDLTGSLTLEARVRSDGDDDGQIIWRGDTRAEHDPYELHVHQRRMEFRIDTCVKGRQIRHTVRSRMPVDRQWHFWSGVHDHEARMLYLYRDGVLQAKAKIAGEITYDTAKMWNMIGAVDHGTWQNFRGSIGEIRVWNVARSANEIRRNHDRPLSGREKGLVAWWHFGRPTGQVVRDLSPHGNHGVLGTTTGPDKADPKWAGQEGN